MSVICVTRMPAAWMARTALSRPAPAPCILTSHSCMPFATATRAASCATIVAANAVDLREPLKPALPAELQEITPPRASAIETWVLLKVERMNAIPAGIDLPLFLAFGASPSAAGAAASAAGAAGATSFLTSSLMS